MKPEPTKAEAIADAILAPDQKAQTALKQRRAAEAAIQAAQRRGAACALAGSAIAVVVAHLVQESTSKLILIGGVCGYLSGLAWHHLTKRARP